MSFPSNFILSNTIYYFRKSKKINDEYINNFLNQYETNICIIQGTIMKSIETENFFETINNCKVKNIGFTSGIRQDLLSDNDIKKFPKNVIIK